MLEFATVRGAAATGLSKKVGRLAPGMQADVVLVSYKRVGLFPLHNPTALVVMYATPADVDTVLIAGKVLKRGGKLQEVDYAALMREAEASADYLPIKDGPATCVLRASALVADASPIHRTSAGPLDWRSRAPGSDRARQESSQLDPAKPSV
jgi:5-methylthioadenosine/S-adenosylhomocysteine deaminase